MAEVTASAGRYTPDQAVQRYLDLLKISNPSKEVRAVIVEIEGEIKQPTRARKKRRARKRVPH